MPFEFVELLAVAVRRLLMALAQFALPQMGRMMAAQMWKKPAPLVVGARLIEQK